MARVFWLPTECLQTDGVFFPPEERHHLLHVLRKKAGERVAVLCGGQRLQVELILRGELLFGRILQTQPIQPPPFSLGLAQGLPKGRKMELVVTLAGQVGVQRLLPFHSLRSIPRLDSPEGQRKRERWQRLADEEAKVTGSPPLQVAPLSTLEEILHISTSLRLFCWENAEQTLLDALEKAPTFPEAGILVIGPEGGFAPEEAQLAEQAGFQAVNLGERILRTEVAGFVAAVLILEHGGAFRLPSSP
ncbi:MAG: 16S rRNA (uracil(1498)-N(3))-methyltransferase [Coprothermobacterota bacterium]|nr:16S rRNA (uracil(1498)-N(3))-methyltransferase [Coprothermobacterota bacterium]